MQSTINRSYISPTTQIYQNGHSLSPKKNGYPSPLTGQLLRPTNVPPSSKLLTSPPVTSNGNPMPATQKLTFQNSPSKNSKPQPQVQVQSRFHCTERVLARCSEGIAYKGHVTEVLPTGNLNVRFDDNDIVEIRPSDVRKILNETVNFDPNCKSGGFAFYFNNFNDGRKSSVKLDNFCSCCYQKLNPALIPQVLKQNSNQNFDVLTCFLCGGSWHINCYKSPVFVMPDTILMSPTKSMPTGNSPEKIQAKADWTAQETIFKVLKGFKCKFCFLHLFTEYYNYCLDRFNGYENSKIKKLPYGEDSLSLPENYHEKINFHGQFRLNSKKNYEKFLTSKFNEIPEFLYDEWCCVTEKFDYNPNSLKWLDNQSSLRRENREEIYCYCGSTGDWHFKMIQCNGCRHWFHNKCILSNTNKIQLLYDTFFIFYWV